MIISESSVSMASQHQLYEQHQLHESLTTWKNDNLRKTQEGSGDKNLDKTAKEEINELAADVSLSQASQTGRQVQVKLAEDTPAPQEELEISLLRRLVEMLTGKKIHLNPITSSPGSEENTVAATSESGTPTEEPPEGWGVIYDYHESHYEAEQVSFAASAQVLTSDGQEIEIAIDLQMSREFYSETNIQLRAGDALKDPLVINFSGNAAELSQETFSFDLDLDGKQDNISFVGPGSGFLALDKNNDGTINDGNELFGPQTGSGFAELARYDTDSNNWIDEADDIYDRLRIWSHDESGNDQLISLGRAGIGALYLGHADTPFSIKDSENNLIGAVKSTGMFLYEDGRAGTVQELDLVV